jgi:hypothetical protein
VYFPGYGWIEFEPTSSQAVFDYTGAEPEQPDRPAASPQTRSTDSAPTPIMIGTGLALLLGFIGGLGYVLWRRYALSQLTPEMQARRLYWETRHALRPLGIELALSATPADYRATCADRLADQPRLRQAIDGVIESYIRAVFTATPPDRSDMVAVRRRWRATWPQRLRCRLRLQARHVRGQPDQIAKRER